MQGLSSVFSGGLKLAGTAAGTAGLAELNALGLGGGKVAQKLEQTLRPTVSKSYSKPSQIIKSGAIATGKTALGAAGLMAGVPSLAVTAGLGGGISSVLAPRGQKTQAFFRGVGQSPMYAGMGKFSQGVTAPLLGKVAPNAVIGSRIGQGILNLGEGVGFGSATGLGNTPTSMSIDFATGILGQPFAGRSAQVSRFRMDKNTVNEVVQAEEMLRNPSKFVTNEMIGGHATKAGRNLAQKQAKQQVESYARETIERLGAKYLPDEVFNKVQGDLKKTIKALVDLNSENKLANVPGMGLVENTQPKGVTKVLVQGKKGLTQVVPESPVGTTTTTLKVPVKTVARSIEQQVTPNLQKSKGAESLPDIINKGDVDVKTKVGWQDYIRTPENVLKKIGLGEEAKVLRTQYDKYLKELPTEIDKVTAWSKQVPAESNQRIFQYLDGQEVALTKQEQKVANEIKKYLGDWADKLGLPEDKRITNYITHIFEKDFIKKEFDPEIAKMLENRVPGSVYDPFVEKRLGKQGYVEDTWRALDAYVKRAARKVNMDPAMEKLKGAAKNLETSQYDYVKTYAKQLNMQPTKLDNLIDNSIKQAVGYKFGQRPTAYLTRKGRQAVFRGTLGLNVGTAVRNLTQGANTYAELGEKYTVKGYWDLLTKGTKEMEEVGVLADNLIQDRQLSAGKQFLQKVDKGLFFLFDTAEKINRGSAYYGAKAKALSQGMNEAEAIEYGKEIVRKTQFSFGSIDTPVALQSDVVKLLAQFQTYSLKQGEFLAGKVKNKDVAGILRYVGANLFMVYTVGQVIGMEPKDMIPSFRIGVPPTLKTPVEVGKALLNTPDEYGQELDTEEKLQNIGKSLIPFVPGGSQIKKTIQGVQSYNQGASTTPTGRTRFTVEKNLPNLAKATMFGQYSLPGAKAYIQNLGKSKSEIEFESMKKMSTEERLTRLKELKQSSPSTFNAVKDRIKDEQLGVTKKERQLRSLPVADRAQSIYTKMKKMSVEERIALLQDYEKKGILTSSVKKELKALIANK